MNITKEITLSVLRSANIAISSIEDELMGIDKDDLSDAELNILGKCKRAKELFQKAKLDIDALEVPK